MQSTEILHWTNPDPRESSLFTQWGLVYRFQTEISHLGQSITYLTKMRGSRAERIARCEWAPNGALGVVTVGRSTISMHDLCRPDVRAPGTRAFRAPDGTTYRWRPSASNPGDVKCVDPNGNSIAVMRQIRPKRYEHGDVHVELHLLPAGGLATGGHPPLLDVVAIAAMLFRFCSAYGL